MISPHIGGRSFSFRLVVWQLVLAGASAFTLVALVVFFSLSGLRGPSSFPQAKSKYQGEAIPLNLEQQIEELNHQQQLIKSILNQIHIPVTVPVKTDMGAPSHSQTPAPETSSVQPDHSMTWYLAQLKIEYAALFEKAKSLQTFAMGIPSIWPVEGPITSGFGYREHPIYGEPQFHQGVDIVAWPGTPIRVVADGVVIYSGWGGTYGYMVMVRHGYGFVTVYGHASEILVQTGDRVFQGQMIAQVGSTGLSTGAHLHYEVRRFDRPISPMPFLSGDVFTAASAVW